MIGTIARKEFLANLLTLRFSVGVLLCLSLAGLSTFVQIKSYNERLINYHDAVRNHQEALSKVEVYSQLQVVLNRPPEVLSILCTGFDRNMGNTTVVRFNVVPELDSSYGRDNLFMGAFASVDIILVVQLILSLLALFLTYDAIAGEKQLGTLRQMLANAVPRYQILIGKYLGAMLTLIIPLVMSFICALLFMLLYRSVLLNARDFLYIGLMLLGSGVYLSLFTLLGIFVSGKVKTASLALVVCLFLWILLVVIIPNSALFTAKYLRPVPSYQKLAQDKQILEQQRDEKTSSLWSETMTTIQKEGKVGGGYSHNDRILEMNIGFVQRDAVPVLVNMVNIAIAWQIDITDKIANLHQRFYDDLRQQTGFANNLSRISPVFSFELVSSIWAGTSLNQQMIFFDQAKIYRGELTQFLRRQKAFSSPLYFTRRVLDNIPTGLTYEDRDKVFHQNPPLPFSLAALPQFKIKQASLIDKLAEDVVDPGLLLFWNIILFLAAVVALLKYDVR